MRPRLAVGEHSPSRFLRDLSLSSVTEVGSDLGSRVPNRLCLCQDGDAKIAPLIFMTFIENAFKYVSRGDEMPNYITIALVEKDGCLEFTCENSYDEAEPSTGGIGLNNAVRRLELLYKDRYQLDISKEQHQYQVHLMLTL